MGIAKEVKDFIRARYPHVLRSASSLAEFVAELPHLRGYPGGAPPVAVAFVDATCMTKYPGNGNFSGDDFMERQVYAPLGRIFAAGPTQIFLCFDRGAPINKDLEHARRYRHTVREETPASEGHELFTDAVIPSADEWPGVVHNKQLLAELMHFITRRLVEPHHDAVKTFHPPLGKSVLVHGGRGLRPNRNIYPVPVAPPEVLYVESYYGSTRGPGGIALPASERRHGTCDEATYPPAELFNLLEAELACLYFARHFPNDNALFVSPDGDMLLQLLLMAADRIEPATGAFRNVHFLELLLPDGAGTNDFVDINALYKAIMDDRELQVYANPVLMFAAASMLIKCDYIHGFAPGVKTAQGTLGAKLVPDYGEPLPVVYQVLYSQATTFRSLLTTTPLERGRLEDNVFVRLNEALWLKFVEAMYVLKYRTAVAKKLKYASESLVTIEDVEQHLRGYKNPSALPMTRPRTRVIGRQLTWTLEYSINSYRNACTFYPPHALYRDQSFYGWCVLPDGKCREAEEVSPERPAETLRDSRMFKRRWEDLDHASQDDGRAGGPDEKRQRSEAGAFTVPASGRHRELRFPDRVERKHI